MKFGTFELKTGRVVTIGYDSDYNPLDHIICESEVFDRRGMDTDASQVRDRTISDLVDSEHVNVELVDSPSQTIVLYGSDPCCVASALFDVSLWEKHGAVWFAVDPHEDHDGDILLGILTDSVGDLMTTIGMETDLSEEELEELEELMAA